MRYAQIGALMLAAMVLAALAIHDSSTSGASLQAQSPARLKTPSSRIQLLQTAEPQPETGEVWKPEEPFKLDGPMPKDEAVSDAIKQSVDYLLAKQHPNGSWDDVLTGTMLSELADFSLDAVSLTALSGMALRAHVGYDRARIEPALAQATNFIMGQVFRGKLPLKVQYASWRYTTGLQFMVGEYQNTTDAERKAEIQACSRRMVSALLKMQLTNGETPLLDRTNAAKISEVAALLKLRGQLGLVLALPTDRDFRGGAPVLEMQLNSASHLAGIMAGDRIVEAEGMRIENAIDYYLLENSFLCGQTITLKVKRAAGNTETVSCPIPLAWAAYLGMEVGGSKSGLPEITRFFEQSPAKAAGCALGDIVTELGGQAIVTPQDYYNQLYKLKIGEQVKIALKRGDQTLSGELIAKIAPDGDLGIYVSQEDVSREEGIPVGASMARPAPGPVVPGPGGAALGMKPGDRLTHVNFIPIVSLDQLYGYEATIPAGIQVRVRWTRNGVASEGFLIARARLSPASLGVVLDVVKATDPPKIKSLVKDGPGATGNLQVGDIIVSIAGINTPTHVFYTRVISKFHAGETVEICVKRGANLLKGNFTLWKADKAFSDVEEGGWAYYPELGESTTFGTSAALLALYDTAKVMGINVPAQSIKAAENLVNSMRCLDPNNAGMETYAYRRGGLEKFPGAKGYVQDVRGCLGRNAICELVMFKAKRRTKADLEKTLNTWLQLRGELDRVRNFPLTHHQELYNNAAYYWLFGHHYSMKAAREVGGKTLEIMNQTVVKALMLKREQDGTWKHHESFGRICGTAMALLAFGETQGAWRK